MMETTIRVMDGRLDLPLDEIVAEVHQYRRERQDATVRIT
jgi:hypothetical protein